MIARMTDASKAIADKVRGVAAEKRFTQARIADTLGIARSSVAERINGRVPFSAPELFVLAGAMSVSIVRFFPEPAERAS